MKQDYSVVVKLVSLGVDTTIKVAKSTLCEEFES